MSKKHCGYCAKTLRGVCIPHTVLECQTRQSMYCVVCMAHGHAPDDCPNKTAWAVRQGQDASAIRNLYLDVPDSEDEIREFLKEALKEYDLKPATRKLDNRKLLRNYANSMNPPRLVRFIQTK